MHPTPVEPSQVKRVAVHMHCCVPYSNFKKLNKRICVPGWARLLIEF